MKAQGLAESQHAEFLDQFGGQVLIDVGVALNPAIEPAQSAQDQTTALIFDWLSFFTTHCPALRDEYALVQRKRLDVGGALKLARHHFSDSDASSGLSDQGASALDVLIGQLLQDAELLTSGKVEHKSQAIWRIPKPNEFLRSALKLLSDPAPATLATFGKPSTETGLIPIRSCLMFFTITCWWP